MNNNPGVYSVHNLHYYLSENGFGEHNNKT